MYIIGIDGGGTGTVGILTTETGRCLAQVQSGPSNYHVVGAAKTQTVLKSVVEALCEKAGIPSTIAIHFCLGMAGLGRAEDRKIIGRICDELGIGENRILTHDAHIALVGGTEKQHGVIVISGTGAIVYGINTDGKEARASGWGYLLGDEGSGYDIAIKGLRAVARAADGRGRPTELTNRILSTLELNAPGDLIRWVHAASRDAIAQLSKVVFDAARTRDMVAEKIIDVAAAELVCAASSVIEQLEFGASFDIVLSGGNLIHQPVFADKLRRQFAGIAPEASVLLPRHDPAYGAVLVAQAKL
ncbi:ATPase [Candidatus Poribacteria bacterium]|nr:ATPase [Candidatus Poribacteria bacterium]MYA98561.1 ATPase [Candidatus Poribacteria bacterium]